MIALLFIYAVKVGYFYYHTGLPMNKVPYAFVTAAGFFLLYLLLRERRWWYFAVSGLLTGLMYADILYFRYFSDLLSLRLLHQASQLTSVLGILVSLMTALDLVLWADLAAYPWLWREWQQQGRRVSLRMRALPLTAALVVIVSISAASHYTGVKQYEFFNHHVFDLITLDFENRRLHPVEHSQVVTAVLKQHELRCDPKYFGLASGRNLIVIQFESLQQVLLGQFYDGQELTPSLNALAAVDSFRFTHYYHQVGAGSSSDAEFVSLNSLYPVVSGNVYDLYEKNDYAGLPWILQEQGYGTYAYHGNVGSFWNRDQIYPRLGFEHVVFEDQYVLHETIGFGLDDHDFFAQTLPFLQNQPEPWFSFLITMTSHKPFRIPKEHRALTLRRDDENLFGDYLQSVHYADHALGQFVAGLKDMDLYDNTLIVIYGDHHGIGTEDAAAVASMERFLGQPYAAEIMLRVPLLVHIPGLGMTETLDITGGHLDLLPTLLNVLGIENRFLTFGRDLLNSDQGFTAFKAYVEPRSFISGTVVYEASRDGVFEHGRAYHRDTHESLPIEEGLEAHIKTVTWFNLNKKILEDNAVPTLVRDIQAGLGRVSVAPGMTR